MIKIYPKYLGDIFRHVSITIIEFKPELKFGYRCAGKESGFGFESYLLVCAVLAFFDLQRHELAVKIWKFGNLVILEIHCNPCYKGVYLVKIFRKFYDVDILIATKQVLPGIIDKYYF